MAESFILGLSSGSACLATCGMAMFPYLMAGSASTRRIVADISVFLLTRLIIYIILATLAWYFGQAVFSSTGVRNYLPGILYIVFAGMLIWYSIGRNPRKECPARIVTVVDNTRFIPVLLGIVNSLGLCPALLIMLTSGATQESLAKSYITFIAFFAGTSIWFVPLPLLGKLKKKQIIATIGVLATGLAGAIFLIKGLTILIGGIINE
jgi:sulfite exporter TauE/SafE